jgi:hypothetical protein
MNKFTETVFGLFGIAILGIAIWFGLVEGFAPELVFFLVMVMFLGLIATIAENVSNALDKIFSPRR